MPVWNPKTKKELIASHYYLHSFWNKTLKGTKIKNWPPSKIIKFHNHIVELMLKKGWKHKSPLRVTYSFRKRPEWWKCIDDCSRCEALHKHNICIKQEQSKNGGK